MRILLNFLVLFGIGGTIALILAQNQGIFAQIIHLRIDVGYLHIRFMPIRLDVFALALVGIGFMWCWLSLTPNGLRRAVEVRKLKKEVRKLQTDSDTSGSKSVALTSVDS